MSSLRRLVVFGDSFVEGYHISDENRGILFDETFVTHLGDFLGVEILTLGKSRSSNLAISNQVMTHIRNSDEESLKNDAFLIVFSEWNRLTRVSFSHEDEHPNVLVGKIPENTDIGKESLQRAETENSYLAVSHICQRLGIPYRMINSFCYQSFLDTITVWEGSRRLGRKGWSMISPEEDPNWIERNSLYNTLYDICAERWLKTGDKPPMVDYLKHTKMTSEKKYFTGCMHPNEKGHRLIAEKLSPYIKQIIRE